LEGEKEGKREKEGEKRSFFVKIVVVHSSSFQIEKKKEVDTKTTKQNKGGERECVCV